MDFVSMFCGASSIIQNAMVDSESILSEVESRYAFEKEMDDVFFLFVYWPKFNKR